MSTFPTTPQPVVTAPPPPIPVVPLRDEPRWEYRRVLRNLRTDEPPNEAELNALGDEGWELVGLFLDSPFLYLYLKRPV